MSNQEQICKNCQEWVNDDMVNPYFMDCVKENCPKFKLEFDKMRYNTKQQVDMLLKLKPERI